MINDTKDWFYVDPTGGLYRGDSPPSGSTVLVAPGGTVDDAVVAKFDGLDKTLAGSGDPAVRRDDAGNPVVVRGGRAIAADVLPGDDEDAKAALEAAGKEYAAKARAEAGKEADAPAKAAPPAAGGKAASAASKAEDEDDEDEPAAGAGVASKAVRNDPASGVEDKAVAGPPAGKAPRRR